MTEAQKKIGGLLFELAAKTARGEIKWKRVGLFLSPKRDFYRTEFEAKIFYYNGAFFLYIFCPPALFDLPPLTEEDVEKWGIVRCRDMSDGRVVVRLGGPSSFWQGELGALGEIMRSSWY